MNEEYHSGRSEFTIFLDFNERIPSSNALSTSSNTLNVGYLYLKDIYTKLNISNFFKSLTSDLK